MFRKSYYKGFGKLVLEYFRNK